VSLDVFECVFRLNIKLGDRSERKREVKALKFWMSKKTEV
jgi:hypothetical protein